MDLASSPSNRKAQSNKLAVFSSIENRSDIVEGRPLHDEMSSETKNQNIRTYNMETKRYAVPQNLKDSFYAIHHIQKSVKDLPSSENAVPTSENMEPVTEEQQPKATGSKKPMTTTTVRGRKRIAPELVHKPVAAAADQNSPPSSHNDSIKRKKSRQQTPKTQRKLAAVAPATTTTTTTTTSSESPSLYQTCIGLWPEQHSLGDYSHDNIQSLSNLLKVRLCQAKFKMMATLDSDNELFSFLAEECVSPKPRSPHSIKFSGKQSKSSLSLVGNGKNLFNRHQHHRYDTLPLTTTKDTEQAHTPKDTASSPQRTPVSKPKERKKKTPRTNAAKTTATKRNTTPKRKSAAADVAPIVQSDGSSVYLCIPCGKKYKNRNGLAYHLERCKYTLKQDEKEEEEASQNGDNTINCICTQNTDEHGTMVQCDKCRIWLHSECVGLTEDNADEIFHCQTCKESMNTVKNVPSPAPNDLMQSLLDAQQSPSDREDISSQNLHDIFSQTTRNDDTQSDDDFPIEEDEACSEIPSSTQLHVWDDFSFTEQLDSQTNNNKTNEPWSMLDEDEPFSSYDNDIPSSSWTMNDINIFSQPPSLLFSETTLSSALDDDAAPLIGDLTTDPQSNCATPNGNEVTTPSVVSNTNTPVHTADGLWFQFANFDDDYHCET